MYTQMHRNRGSLKNCAGNVRACAVSLSLPRVSSLPHMYEWSVIRIRAVCSVPRSSPVHPPMTTRRGQPYMTSAHFFYPLPPCQYHKSVDFVSFVCFWGSPYPPTTADVIYGSPSRVPSGAMLRNAANPKFQIEARSHARARRRPVASE